MSKNNVGFIISNGGTISLVVNKKSFSIEREHESYHDIVDLLKDMDSLTWSDWDVKELLDLVDVPTAINNYAGGVLNVVDGVIYHNGEELHHVMVDRVLNLMREGLPFQPVLNFLANLLENPSKRAQSELYPFLQHKGMPLTADGHFLGYKRVRENWMDVHSGTVMSKVGDVVEMKRNEVDDNWGVACSQGLHVGCLDYVRNYSSGGHVLIVKVNPRDVVSVPSNESTKLRTCRYEVVGTRDDESYLEAPVYDTVRTDNNVGYVPVERKKVNKVSRRNTRDNHKTQKRGPNGRFI